MSPSRVAFVVFLLFAATFASAKQTATSPPIIVQRANPPLETIVTDQCVDFPLPFLLSTLANPDEAFRYVGAESLSGTTVQHIQL